MKISIVVPVYNVEEYLEACLDSILLTEIDDYEVVCVNDGSTDGSLKILETYNKIYGEKIKIINKENGGLSDARNVGIVNSLGEYIGFVDSDDWIKPNMFGKMYEAASKHNADMVVCSYIEYYPDYNKVIIDTSKKHKLLYEPPVWNKIFKKELFVDIKFSKGLWYEDNEITYKALLLSNKVVEVNDAMYYYRKNRSGSIMNSQKNSKIYDMYTIGDKLYDFYQKYGEDKEIRKQMEYLFIKNIFVRQFKKIVEYERPNLINIFTSIRRHVKYLNNKFPNWINNELLVSDYSGYFREKIGKKYITILKFINILYR